MFLAILIMLIVLSPVLIPAAISGAHGLAAWRRKKARPAPRDAA